MKLFRSKAMLVRYTAFYAGVALLSCMLIGLTLFSFSVKELNQAAAQEQTRKLALASEYMESQIEVMQNVAFRIQAAQCYRPSVFMRNKFDEITLLKDFQLYANYTPLTSDYFLVYPEIDYVFKPAATNDFSIYMQSMHRICDSQALLEQFRSTDAFQIFSSAENNEVLFFSFPVRFAGTESATLCFALYRSSLVRITEQRVGRFAGNVIFEVNDTQVSPLDTPAAAETLHKSCGIVTCRLIAPPGDLYESVGAYRSLVFLLISGSVAVMLGLAIYLSYRSYRPIRELVLKSERLFTIPVQNQNEFERISETLNAAFENTQRSIQQMNEEMNQLEQQRAIIRAQLVQLILSGRAGDDVDRQLQHIGVHFPIPYYAVAVVIVDKEVSFIDRLMHMIDGLTDQAVHLFTARLRNESGFAILMVTDDDGDAQEAMELVEAILDEAGAPRESALGFVTEHIEDVPKSFMDALSTATLDRENPVHAGNMQMYGNITLPQLCAAIQNANEEQAIDIFSRLASHMERRQESEDVKRTIYSDIITMLTVITEKNKLDVPYERLNTILQEDTAHVCLSISSAIREICIQNKKNLLSAERRISKAILDYLGNHAGEYDISLGKMAETFSMSERQLSRIVKDVTGLPYKEYLTAIRIARACILLTEENISVAATAEQVGFPNVSHFIRVFKSITDYTPANYRKCMGEKARKVSGE